MKKAKGREFNFLPAQSVRVIREIELTVKVEGQTAESTPQVEGSSARDCA
jgi:hypothetical protein